MVEARAFENSERPQEVGDRAFRLSIFLQGIRFRIVCRSGVNREQMPDAKDLTKLMKSLKDENVFAIFPERESNPKILTSLTRDTGIKLGGELIADGRGVTSYEEMMRANVTAIVTALSAK